MNDEMKERAPKTSWERVFIGEGTVFSKTLEWKLTGSKNSKECVAGLKDSGRVMEDVVKVRPRFMPGTCRPQRGLWTQSVWDG